MRQLKQVKLSTFAGRAVVIDYETDLALRVAGKREQRAAKASRAAGDSLGRFMESGRVCYVAKGDK